MLYTIGGMSTADEFKASWKEAENKYGKNTWKFNKYIWENWYCQQTGGNPHLKGYIKALDAQAETFIKGTTKWNERNCYSRTNMMYFTADEISAYWTCGADGLNLSRTSSNEKERFTTVENKELGRSGNIDASSFLSTAQGVWKQVCSKFTTYGGAGHIPPYGNTMDCSAYVSWVLYEYGYEEFEGSQEWTGGFYEKNWNERYGWTEISVAAGENPSSKLQPGDIFVRHGSSVQHVLIYVAPGKSYDCGGSSNWLGKNGEPCNFVDMLTGDRAQAPGKIIRVTKPK